jgi:sigma-B regulation protein RsbU (phosphoserine phosphatase)
MFLIAGSFLAYFGLLVYCDFWGPQPLGVLTEFGDNGKIVRALFARSPAERAGLRVGDRITAVNGVGIHNLFDWTPIRVNFEVGRPFPLSVEREGRTLGFSLILQRASWDDWTSREGLLLLAVRAAQLVTLCLSLFIAFSRPQDAVARAGSWLLATAATTSLLLPYGMAATWRQLPGLLSFLMWIPLASTLVAAPLACTFFALFPLKLIRSRWVWVLLWAPVFAMVPSMAHYAHHMLYRPWTMDPISEWQLIFYNSTFPLYIVAGLLAMMTSYRRLEDTHLKRRVRVLVAGTVVGWLAILPVFLYWWAPASRFAPAFFMSPAMVLTIVLFMAFPLSFAYVIVKHRVLEIPVILRRSARYVFVQRGSVVLLLLIGIALTAFFIRGYLRVLQPGVEAALPVGMALGVVLGLFLAWAGSRTGKQVARRLDRAFFRKTYDARRILENLVDDAPRCSSRQELAALITRQLKQSLHPGALAVYFASEAGDLGIASEAPGPDWPPSLPADSPALAELARRNLPRSVDPEEVEQAGLGFLKPLAPECLVPVVTLEGRLAGLVVLGMSLSEEPYSGEDKRLLAAAARQAAIVLQSIHLAEKMAERLEVERREAHELEIARQVQTGLLPQKKPALRTLEYEGDCIQARAVGGDYYDYIEIGADCMSLVLADISGKGMSAALLMANLQASLRGQSRLASENPASFLRSVNRLFKESAAEGRFATLFLGIYDDLRRGLRYVNCGHNPPLIFRSDGSVERLHPTALPLGLFDEWNCEVAETLLQFGETLVAFSDGVTEAWNAREEEFGEERLIGAIYASYHLPVVSLHKAVVAEVRAFSRGEQRDDLTLLIARAR